MELKTLHIPATEETPEVYLTAVGDSRITGRSLPENAFDFYDPILQWVKAYATGVSAPLCLKLQFEYFNSSSGRYLFEILYILEQSRFKEMYRIEWVTEKEDELMIEKGLELRSLCALSFELVVAD